MLSAVDSFAGSLVDYTDAGESCAGPPEIRPGGSAVRPARMRAGCIAGMGGAACMEETAFYKSCCEFQNSSIREQHLLCDIVCDHGAPERIVRANGVRGRRRPSAMEKPYGISSFTTARADRGVKFRAAFCRNGRQKETIEANLMPTGGAGGRPSGGGNAFSAVALRGAGWCSLQRGTPFWANFRPKNINVRIVKVRNSHNFENPLTGDVVGLQF